MPGVFDIGGWDYIGIYWDIFLVRLGLKNLAMESYCFLKLLKVAGEICHSTRSRSVFRENSIADWRFMPGLSHIKFLQRRSMAVYQNLVPLVNIKIAGKWMFIPLKWY